MVHHVVVWELKKSLSLEEREKTASALLFAAEKLKTIPGVVDFEITRKVHAKTTMKADIVLHSTHATEADLEMYYDHPVHLEFVDAIKDMIEGRERLDFIV